MGMDHQNGDTSNVVKGTTWSIRLVLHCLLYLHVRVYVYLSFVVINECLAII